MPAQMGAIVDPASLNATTGAAAISLKSGVDTLVSIGTTLAAYNPEEMVANGMAVDVDQASDIKAALAEADEVYTVMMTKGALRRLWGLGV